MRRLWLGIGLATLAACSKAPGTREAASTDASVSDLAFAYTFSLRLPGGMVAEAQEQQAQACEQLGAGRCRITGMSYNVDDGGDAFASLSLAVAAPLARRFGQAGVAATKAAGGALVAAEFAGTDTAGPREQAATAGGNAAGDLAHIDRELARRDLPASERAELRQQRATALEAVRAAADAATQAAQSVATAPVTFAWRAGRGVGLAARLDAAGQTALASLVTALSAVLFLLSLLGPPLLLLLALALAWRRWGARAWSGLLRATRPKADITAA